MRINGCALRLLLDTGTDDIRLFKTRVHACVSDLGSRGTALTLNAGGEDRLEEVEIPDIRVADIRLRRQTVFLWNTPTTTAGNFDGLLGPTALGLRRMEFDSERNVLSFVWK